MPGMRRSVFVAAARRVAAFAAFGRRGMGDVLRADADIRPQPAKVGLRQAVEPGKVVGRTPPAAPSAVLQGVGGLPRTQPQPHERSGIGPVGVKGESLGRPPRGGRIASGRLAKPYPPLQLATEGIFQPGVGRGVVRRRVSAGVQALVDHKDRQHAAHQEEQHATVGPRQVKPAPPVHPTLRPHSRPA